jgi:hypothetical protein
LYSFNGNRPDGFCDACFTGKYPVEVPDRGRQHELQLPLFEAARD